MKSPLERPRPRAALVVFAFALFAAPALAAPPEDPPAATAPATAPAPDLVTKGQQLFEDQQYEESIQALSGALLRPNNTKEQKIEIYRLLALNYITLGRHAEADSAVRGLLAVEPDYALPASESPRFRDFFADTRAAWEAEGRPGLVKEATPVRPVVFRHGSPTSAERGKAIELRGQLDDPDGRTGRIELYYRAGTRGDFAVAPVAIDRGTVRAQLPAAAVKPPVVDYYFEVVDAAGTVLASRGDAQAPLRVAVPDGGGASWVLPVAIGGGLLGAAAIVGGLALAGVFDGSPEPARSTVTINVGEAGLRW